MAQGQKTGGRTAGTPNKITSDLKGRIGALLDQQFDSIVADLDRMEPKDRVTVYLKLMEYVLPKQREIKEETQQRITLIDDLDSPSPHRLTPEDVRVFREEFGKKYA